jgi:hypothetical protein
MQGRHPATFIAQALLASHSKGRVKGSLDVREVATMFCSHAWRALESAARCPTHTNSRVRSYSSPVEATAVTRSWQKADTTQVIIHQAAGTEANRHIDRGQCEDYEIKGPPERCGFG